MDRVNIAVDVDSGDFGTSLVMQGVVAALESAESPITVHLCGERTAIEQQLIDHGDVRERFHDAIIVHHAPERISPNEGLQTMAWRNKRDASIIKCITLQREGVVRASVSAGDTGVLMSAALFILGRGKGVLRPALGAFLPTVKRRPVLLLDVGANLNCRREHLVSFAFMGIDYMRRRYDVPTPRVALLNIGRESLKGTPLIRDTDRILQKRCPSYIGFNEGGEVLSGTTDVIVCDGFVGNVLLKACESFHLLIGSVLADDQELLCGLQKHLTTLNAETYGAVPFLGINGMVLKAHGSSSARAIANAVLAAQKAVP